METNINNIKENIHKMIDSVNDEEILLHMYQLAKAIFNSENK
jgi:hypothetical protein